MDSQHGLTPYEQECLDRGLAVMHNGRLLPVLRGGSPASDSLFPSIPEDLAAVADDELAGLQTTIRERITEVLASRRDPDVVGDRTQSQVADEMQAAVLAVEALEAEITARATADDEYDSKMVELAAKAGVKDETAEEAEEKKEGEEPKETAAVVEETPEVKTPVTAAARRALPAAKKNQRPVQIDDDGLGLRLTSHTAGLGVPYDAMTVLDREHLGIVLTDVIRRNRVQHGQKAVVAHASFEFPKERILDSGPDGYETNASRIRAVSPEALVASGENCAPLPPRYELTGVETPARPVRDALQSFQAARGGVQVGATPTMGDYALAVGSILASENALGGTHSVKSCMRIECPEFTPVAVDSIYHCTEADNLAARAYPELMSRIADLVLAEHSRLADSKLLQEIKDGSTQVTGGAIDAGSLYYWLGDVRALAAGVRSRNRMPREAILDALIPAWFVDELALDIARNQFREPPTNAEVDAIIRRQGINPYYYLDGPATGTGQVFGPQSDGSINAFPDEVQWCVYPPTSWLHLDSGELQLGVVRDSSLNATNDFQIFGEIWEKPAFVGVESDWVTTTICPSGTKAAGTDMTALCGGD